MNAEDRYKTTNDVEVYNKLINLIETNSKWLRDTIPSFIIEESLQYFILKEDYDKCVVLRDFVDINPARVAKISRKEWFDSI
jgi:hypothetical protein